MKGHQREIVLIAEDVIMRWSARPEKTAMALQIEVKLHRISHLAVDHCACWTVSAPVSVSVMLREKPDVVTFSDDDKGDFRRNFQVGTGSLQRLQF